MFHSQIKANYKQFGCNTLLRVFIAFQEMNIIGSTMNEYAILMKLLTRSGNPIGAGVEDMLAVLSLPEVAGRGVLFQKMGALNEQLRPIGMKIKHNPIDHVFYVDTLAREDIDDESVLPDRLASTLLIVITLAYQNNGWVSIDQVKKLRRKSLQGVRKDLRELAALSYVDLDKRGKRVRPGTRVAFEIDYERFFRRLSAPESS
ncbi:MAG: hypothetical protein GF411_02665 [Candidatus Lokiarchaeota archaeon]|nr:hypothetical protein [Candidatus Lokiarchaeota archaeon]